MKYRFAAFEFDADGYELRRDGEVVETTPQALAILKFLLVSRNRLVTKDELVEEVWDGRAISDAAITVRMRALRQVLGDSGAEQNLIRTVRGLGFRFVGDVTVEQSAASAPAPTLAAIAPSNDYERNQDIPDVPGSNPRIAVLPFELLGPEGELDLLARALPDEILTALSKLRSLAVIARGSSFQYSSFSVSPSELRRVLGADYCLSGQLEIKGERLALSLELVDTRSEGVIWRESYDKALSALDEIRDQTALQVSQQIEERISRNEMLRIRLGIPENVTAWQLYHQGTEATFHYIQPDLSFARECLQKAADLAPSYARPYAGLSIVHSMHAQFGDLTSADEQRARAAELARRARDLDPIDPACNIAIARTAFLRGDEAGSRAAFAEAIENSPSYAAAYFSLARMEAYSGNSKEAWRLINQGHVLSPLEDEINFNAGTRILVRLAEQDFGAALPEAQRLRQRQSNDPLTLMLLVAAFSLNGRDAEAREAADMLKAAAPGMTLDRLVTIWPTLSSSMQEILREGLSVQELA